MNYDRPRNSGLVSRWVKDASAILLLVILIVTIFIPAISGGRGLFMDDLAMDEFPWMYFMAKQLQQGTIPLWRPAVWCGARIHFTEYYSSLYYPPLWPFMLLADLKDIDGSYIWLHLVPLLLHYCLAGFGVYILARRILRFGVPGSFFTAAFYSFSPTLMYVYVYKNTPWVLSLLPWILLTYLENIARPRVRLLLIGGILFALMFAAGMPPYLWYSMAVLGFGCAGMMIKSFRENNSGPFWRPPAVLLAYIAIGSALAAVYWLPSLEGGETVRQGEVFDYEVVAGGDASLPPIYLATLVAPDLFGGITGTRLWGNSFAGATRYWEANMTGGLAVTLLVLLGAALPWFLSPGDDQSSRRWRLISIIGSSIYLFGIFCALGRHTPFYRLIYRCFPVVGQFPYPIRYRMMQCLAASVLAGLGYYILLNFSRKVSWALLNRVVGYYLLAVFLVVSLAISLPNDLTGALPGNFEVLNKAWAFPGVMEVFYRGDLSWFFSGPVLTLLGGILIIALAVRFLPVRSFAWLVVFLSLLEVGDMAYRAFYYATFDRRIISPQHERFRKPSSHPMYRRMLVDLPELISEPLLRVATDRPFHDNLQQFRNGFALMGYDMKPLEPRFREAIEKAYGQLMDWSIYLSRPRPKHLPFLSNMSVGYLLDSNPESPFPGGGTESLKSSPGFYLHPNPEALPRAFTVDRIVESTPYEQLNWLVKGDIRRSVFMTMPPLKAGAGAGAGIFTYKKFLDLEERGSGPTFREHFEELQQVNRITALELGNPNSVELEIEVSRPAMLVLTEVWHPGWKARVDGKETKLYQVNYCQRGVWLDRGKHRVELNFRPRIWMVGAGVSIFSWAALIIVALVLWIKKRIGRRKAQRLGNDEAGMTNDEGIIKSQ